MWIFRFGVCLLKRIIGRYCNWLDIQADIKKEGLEAWKERNIPKAYSLPEVPEGWITPDEVEFQYAFSEEESEQIIRDSGGKQFRMGGYEVLAAEPKEVEKAISKLQAKRRYEDTPEDTRINMMEAVKWSGISRRTLDRHVDELGVHTDQMFYGKRCVRMIEPQGVIQVAWHLCQHRPDYYGKALNSFLKEISRADFDPSLVKAKIRSKATGSSKDN